VFSWQAKKGSLPEVCHSSARQVTCPRPVQCAWVCAVAWCYPPVARAPFLRPSEPTVSPLLRGSAHASRGGGGGGGGAGSARGRPLKKNVPVAQCTRKSSKKKKKKKKKMGQGRWKKCRTQAVRYAVYECEGSGKTKRRMRRARKVRARCAPATHAVSAGRRVPNGRNGRMVYTRW